MFVCDTFSMLVNLQSKQYIQYNTNQPTLSYIMKNATKTKVKLT